MHARRGSFPPARVQPQVTPVGGVSPSCFWPASQGAGKGTMTVRALCITPDDRRPGREQGGPRTTRPRTRWSESGVRPHSRTAFRWIGSQRARGARGSSGQRVKRASRRRAAPAALRSAATKGAASLSIPWWRDVDAGRCGRRARRRRRRTLSLLPFHVCDTRERERYRERYVESGRRDGWGGVGERAEGAWSSGRLRWQW